MGIVLSIVLFLVLSGICASIVLADGVETVAGLVAAILLGADITRWSDRGIRLLRVVSCPGLGLGVPGLVAVQPVR